MPGLDQLTSVWKNIKEFELAPIRKEALQDLNIILIGSPGSGRSKLADQMRRDPRHQYTDLESPLPILTLGDTDRAQEADLILLFLKAEEQDYSQELAACRAWGNQGKKVIVLCDTEDARHQYELLRNWAPWNASALLCGPFEQEHWLSENFIKVMLKLLPGLHLALGRNFPLFRVTIARQLIQDTCYTNAAYALGSGIAEVVPVLNIPLNITDMIVITKAQAFLVYRLGLLLGFSTAWQDYLAEFGGVIGGGFVWRQLARFLVGLIPVWGIVPKIAVAYSGTYVVGNTILQWYLTGRHLNAQQMRDLYRQALAQGKQTAQILAQKLPKPKFKLPTVRQLGRKQTEALTVPQEIPILELSLQDCTECGKISAPDARFCQYCGHPFAEAES